MAYTNKIAFNNYYFFDATALLATYEICHPGLDEPSNYMKIINTSDVNVLVSYDGTHAHDVVLSGGAIEICAQLNNEPRSHVALLAKGMPVYVAREVNPGASGYIYVITYYQPTL